jgi:hypothetical protein
MADETTKPAVEALTPPEFMKVFNRPINAMLGTGLMRKRVGDSIVSLEFTGSKSGKTYRLPVGQHELLGKRSVFTRRTWGLNFRGGADAKLRLGDGWHDARGTLVDDPETVARAYLEGVKKVGWEKAKGTLGLKINVGREPTIEELKDYVQRTGYRVIQFDMK